MIKGWLRWACMCERLHLALHGRPGEFRSSRVKWKVEREALLQSEGHTQLGPLPVALTVSLTGKSPVGLVRLVMQACRYAPLCCAGDCDAGRARGPGRVHHRVQAHVATWAWGACFSHVQHCAGPGSVLQP
eukprot:354460-Chlamydomonas_euryale.AAC.8